MTESRYQRALRRNLHEATQAIYECNAYNAIMNCDTAHGMDFFRVVFYSLNNDMVAHAIKLLDRSSKSASFWYIFRCKQKDITTFAEQNSLSIRNIELMSEKLKSIRDKTHFHIDREAVFNPAKVWQDADIEYKQFFYVLNSIRIILDHLYFVEFGKNFGELAYDGADVGPILRAVKATGVVEFEFNLYPKVN